MMVDDVVDVVVDVAVIPPDDGWFALGGWMDGWMGGALQYISVVLLLGNKSTLWHCSNKLSKLSLA